MKSQNLMLNETIFNALVKGHAKNGFVFRTSLQLWYFCILLCRI